MAACSTCSVTVLSHSPYGAAAAVIAWAAAPCQEAPASSEVTELNEVAAEANSPARPSQAAAASNIGADPAPENIRIELISGGNTEKFMSHPFLTSSPSSGGRCRFPNPEPVAASYEYVPNKYPLICVGDPRKGGSIWLFRTLLISLPRSVLMGRWTASRGRGGAPAAQRGRTTSRPTRMRRILGRCGVRQRCCGSSHVAPPRVA